MNMLRPSESFVPFLLVWELRNQYIPLDFFHAFHYNIPRNLAKNSSLLQHTVRQEPVRTENGSEGSWEAISIKVSCMHNIHSDMIRFNWIYCLSTMTWYSKKIACGNMLCMHCAIKNSPKTRFLIWMNLISELGHLDFRFDFLLTLIAVHLIYRFDSTVVLLSSLTRWSLWKVQINCIRLTKTN
jgi:hypothetical protein